MREIKFRALLNDGDKKWWEYYTTFSQPAWLDLQDVEITILDLQYTGLKDKNGLEIYEGDIFSDGVMTCVVKFQEMAGHMAFSGYSKLGSCVGLTDIEIIGNIYENRELLNG